MQIYRKYISLQPNGQVLKIFLFFLIGNYNQYFQTENISFNFIDAPEEFLFQSKSTKEKQNSDRYHIDLQNLSPQIER
jgi:hypothetical protein